MRFATKRLAAVATFALALSAVVAVVAGTAGAGRSAKAAAAGSPLSGTPKTTITSGSSRTKLVGSIPKFPSAAAAPATDTGIKQHPEFDIPKASRSAKAPPPPLPPPVVAGSVVTAPGHGVSTARGLNAYENRYANGFNVEPPDQAMCTNGVYIFEAVNDVARIFRADATPFSSVATLNQFFMEPSGGPTSAGGDPICYYDKDTDRWFVVELAFINPANPATFQSFVEIMVSKTNDPNLGWNKYVLDTTNGTGTTPGHPNCPCLGDQPRIGADRWAFFVSTNEFPWFVNGFNGAQIYGIDKIAMANGLAPNAFVVNTFGIPTPDGTCAADGTCWYSVEPTQAPEAQYGVEDQDGGIEFLLSSLEFFGTGDNRIAFWAFTGVSSVRSAPGSAVSVSVFQETVPSEVYNVPPPSTQMDGPTPLHDVVYPTTVKPGLIDSGDDRMQQAEFVNGNIVSSLNTIVSVGDHDSLVTRAGIAWFAVDGLTATMTSQGYIAARNNNVIYGSPAILQDGGGAFVYTLVGPDFWPSGAYTPFSLPGTAGGVIDANPGQSPQDGFTEYRGCPGTSCRPRWGDYSAGQAFGGKLYLAGEYIQYPNCSNAEFTVDRSCGGTRGSQSNWGTFIDVVTP